MRAVRAHVWLTVADDAPMNRMIEVVEALHKDGL